MMKYVLFLRGINVGGHKKVPMAELREMLGGMGFNNVKTLLNSGNVVFKARKTSEQTLIKKIDANFQETFGFESKLMIRTMDAIQFLVDSDPFGEIDADKDTRLYVTFLPEKSKSQIELPYASPDESFRILQKTEREVFSVLDLKKSKTVKAMDILEKEFGKEITTRNWNTVLKIAAL